MTDRPWLTSLSADDLADLHHACRLLAIRRDVVGSEFTRYTELADAIWNEIARRSSEAVA